MIIFDKNGKMEFESLGLLGLFLASFLAATILPFSSEAMLIYFLYKGIDPTSCLLVVTLGNSLGGITNIGIGRLGNPLWLKRIGVTESTIYKREKWVIKYGSFLAFFSWIPIIGDPLLVVLGYFRSRVWSTTIWMVFGKFLRYLVFVLAYTYK
jgi:membrane protein YqaA with SNARE-associated domain